MMPVSGAAGGPACQHLLCLQHTRDAGRLALAWRGGGHNSYIASRRILYTGYHSCTLAIVHSHVVDGYISGREARGGTGGGRMMVPVSGAAGGPACQRPSYIYGVQGMPVSRGA
jgi:hypothetical protein